MVLRELPLHAFESVDLRVSDSEVLLEMVRHGSIVLQDPQPVLFRRRATRARVAHRPGANTVIPKSIHVRGSQDSFEAKR